MGVWTGLDIICLIIYMINAYKLGVTPIRRPRLPFGHHGPDVQLKGTFLKHILYIIYVILTETFHKTYNRFTVYFYLTGARNKNVYL